MIILFMLYCLLLPFILAVQAATQQSEYRLFKHPAHSDAKCIDGSPGAMYISEGDNQNILIYFEGGAMCFGLTLNDTIQNCYKRSLTSLGSSINYTETMNLSTFTILSNDQKTNPLFHNWTKVYIPYCDGVLHQGRRNTTVDYKGNKLYFRGMDITIAHFNYLHSKYHLLHAKKVVMSGTSAGSMAAMAWANVVYNKLSQSSKMMLILDSGLFITDFLNPFTKSTPGIDAFKAIKSLAFTERQPPFKECLAVESKLDCQKFGVLANYVKPPMFVIESQYDLYSIHNILLLNCPRQSFPASLQKCSDIQMNFIEQYRQKSMESLKNVTKYSKNAVWAISCSQHGFLFNNALYDSKMYMVPPLQGKTILEALTDFINGKPKNYIDTLKWPQNAPCSPFTVLQNLRQAATEP